MAEALAAVPGVGGQLHAADGDAARRGRLGREGRRRRQDVRPRRAPCSSGSASRCGSGSSGCRGVRRPAGGGAVGRVADRDRHRSERRGALRAERRPTSRNSSRPPSAARRRPRSSTARGASRSSCGCPTSCDADREAIGALTLTAPGGEKVPLSRIAADPRRRRRPEAINHENGERRLVVQANVRGRDVGSFVAEAQVRARRRCACRPATTSRGAASSRTSSARCAAW